MPNTAWIYNSWEGYWTCQNCKVDWNFNADGPQENGVKYCPVCGYRITDFVEPDEE